MTPARATREEQVVIGDRYCGPPDSGNGGYVSGLLASFFDGPAQVTLRRPAPIGEPLLVRPIERGVALLEADAIVAEAVAGDLELDTPMPVPPPEAVEAALRSSAFVGHPFPTCFVCGPHRAEDDGLRIFPGPVTGRNVVAAPWTPDRTLTDDDGLVRREFLWAALDCAGAFASGFPEIRMVLGRLTAQLVRPLPVGERCVVLGWPEGSERRKHLAGTAVFTGEGDLVAVARATWISVPPAGS